jgi:hypothetical protein
MSAWVDRWKAQSLNPCQPYCATSDVEDEPVYMEDCHLAMDTLASGDVFAVIAMSDNEELVEYPKP